MTGAVARLHAKLGQFFAALALVSAALVFAMVVLITVNVALRGSGLSGIVWTDEVSEYALYALTLLAAPWLLHRSAHIRVDVLLISLPARMGWMLEIIADMMGLAVCLIFVRYGAAAALESARLGSLTIKSLVFPEWWLIAPLPAVFLLLAVEFVFRLQRAVSGPRQPTRSSAAGLA